MKKNIAAFGLIEVLITLLILAIGLLGIAALQYRGLQYSHDAYLRSQVNVLVYDIADKIRIGNTDAAGYAAAINSGNPDGWEVPPARPGGCDLDLAGVVSGGNSDNIVDNDVACWRQQVFDALPPGSRTHVASPEDPENPIYTITLTWFDRELIPHQVAYSFRP